MGYDKHYTNELSLERCPYCNEPHSWGSFGTTTELAPKGLFRHALVGCTNVECFMYNHAFARIVELQAILDGDPHRVASKEVRFAWRLSAVRYAEKIEKLLIEACKMLLEKGVSPHWNIVKDVEEVMHIFFYQEEDGLWYTRDLVNEKGNDSVPK